MGLKSDKWIRKQADKFGLIEPYEGGVIRHTQSGQAILSYGTSSYGYDLRCASKFKLFNNMAAQVLDPKSFDASNFVDLVNSSCVIPPGGFALAHSVEYLRMPKDVLGIVLAKTTYARCGLSIQASPLEPGWHGNVTFSIANSTPLPIRVHANEGIAQVLFFQGDEVCASDYSARRGLYQGQRGLVMPKTT